MELMFTLVIAGVLLGLAVPSFRGMVHSNRVLSQSNDIVGALNLARSEAITRNANITLCRAASATSTSCSTSSSTWAAWVVLNGSTLIRGGEVNNFNSTLKVTSTLTNQSITYSPDGLGRTNGALVGSQYIQVCTTYTKIDKNIYQVAPGVGSRIVTTTSKGTC